MSDIDPEKLKVAELRDELKARGLDVKGVKAVLVQRLRDALESEGNEGGAEEVGSCEEATENLGQKGGEEDFEIVEAADDDDEEEAEGGEPEEAEAEAEPEATEADAAEPQAEAASEEPAAEEAAVEEAAPEATNGDEPAAAAEEEGDEEMPEELGEEFKTIDEAGDGDDRGSKRKRSRSPRDRHRGDRRRRSRSPVVRKVEMDDCAWETGTTFQIDRYNCDLNLRVQENGLKAHPLTVEGFAFMWAGARAMYGVKAGKVAYEVKLMDNLNVDHLPSDETTRHVLRVGWSADDTSMQLGEESLSFGFGGTGKASTECQFKDFGEKFSTGDVITAYVDMESDPVTLSYSKNGNDLGVCFEVEKEKLEERALFPHILTKNTEFQMNFGALEEPFFPLKEEFVFMETLGEEEKVRGSPPPATKEECEIVMMVGLPGAGKTYWADKHAIANLDKKYNVLGTNNIIDKMKVMGLPRKKNYTGRWDVLIDKSTKCLNRLIEIAARKKRNYILDQTNVYASARRRKMQPFEGFQRKAVVVIPTEEEHKSRNEKREKEEGKEIPEKAILEMKANFTVPEVGQLFDNVELSEAETLNAEDAATLVAKMKEEAEKLLPPPDKRSRFSDRGRRDFNRDNRPRGGYRGGFDKDRRGGGGYNQRGGYNDRNSRGGRPDNRRFDDRRSYGSGSGGNYRSSGGYQGGQRSGGYGSSSSGYGNNSGGYKGGWNQQGSWGNQGNQGYQGWGNQGYGNRQQQQGYGQWPQQSQWNQQSWGNQQQGYGYGSGYGSYGSSSGYGSGYGSYGYGK